MEIKQFIIDILVKKIQIGEINPITNEAFKLEDIKIEEYRNTVNSIINPI